eukprot:Awhi_evm1s15132
MPQRHSDGTEGCCLGDAWDILMDHLEAVRVEVEFFKKAYPKQSKNIKSLVDIPKRTRPSWVEKQQQDVIDLTTLPTSIALEVTEEQQKTACKVRELAKVIHIPNFSPELSVSGFHVVYDTYDGKFEKFPEGLRQVNKEIKYVVQQLKDEFRSNDELFQDLLDSENRSKLLDLENRRVKGQNYLKNFYAFVILYRKCAIVQSTVNEIEEYEEQHRQAICGAVSSVDILFDKYKLKFKGIKSIWSRLTLYLSDLTKLKENPDKTVMDYKTFIKNISRITEGLESFHIFKDGVIESEVGKLKYDFQDGIRLSSAVVVVTKLVGLANDKVLQFDYHGEKSESPGRDKFQLASISKQLALECLSDVYKKNHGFHDTLKYRTMWNQWKHALNNMTILREIFKNSLFIAVAKNVIDLSKLSFIRTPVPVLQQFYEEYKSTIKDIQRIDEDKLYKDNLVIEDKMVFMDLVGIFDETRQTTRVIERYDPFKGIDHVGSYLIPLRLEKVNTCTGFIVGPTAAEGQIQQDYDSDKSDDDDGSVDNDEESCVLLDNNVNANVPLVVLDGKDDKRYGDDDDDDNNNQDKIKECTDSDNDHDDKNDDESNERESMDIGDDHDSNDGDDSENYQGVINSETSKERSQVNSGDDDNDNVTTNDDIKEGTIYVEANEVKELEVDKNGNDNANSNNDDPTKDDLNKEPSKVNELEFDNDGNDDGQNKNGAVATEVETNK